MKLDDLKSGLNSFWNSVTDGWRSLHESAAEALTHFKPTDKSDLPAAGNIDDASYSPATRWGMLASNVFEDEKSVVVRLEIPGLDKDNARIDVVGDTLVISGEKRFERDHSEGRYRVFQCAYGSFQRSVRLPVAVLADQAKASYRRGVLEINLPKAAPARPKVIDVKIG